MKQNDSPSVNQTKISVGDWLAAARKRLAANHPSATIETQAMLAWVTGKPRSTLLAHPESILTLDQKQVADNALDRLIQGIPLPYITGTQEFYGLSFRVSPAVLIPRPETELLVETALQAMQSHPSPVQALDVGTGSGAIAVSLAVCNSAIHVTALDISPAALEIARCNALQHNVEQRILYLHENLTNNLQGRFDLVCANLPYIPTETTLQLDVARHEPQLALDGGADGLRLIERLLSDLPHLLARPGLALLEIEYRQGESAQSLARRYLPDAHISVKRDLAGLDRLLQIRLE